MRLDANSFLRDVVRVSITSCPLPMPVGWLKKDGQLKKILDNQERLWYNVQLKGGSEMCDIDDLIFTEDYKTHSEK